MQVIYVPGQYENERIFPSLKRRGGAKRRGGPFGEIFRPEGRADLTTPALLQRWLRDILSDVAVARVIDNPPLSAHNYIAS